MIKTERVKNSGNTAIDLIQSKALIKFLLCLWGQGWGDAERKPCGGAGDKSESVRPSRNVSPSSSDALKEE